MPVNVLGKKRQMGAFIDNLAGKEGRAAADRMVSREGVEKAAELTERQWEDIARKFWPAARDEHAIPYTWEGEYVGVFASQARRQIRELSGLVAPGAVKP